MNSIYFFNLPLLLIALITLVLIIVFNWLGHFYRQWQMKKYPGVELGHLGAIEGALLGLLTLMLAFSYGIVATRYEVGRQLIVDESKIVTVAINRCDLYPDSLLNGLHSDFKRYVEARINFFISGTNEDKIALSLKDGRNALDRIRGLVMSLPQNQDNHFRTLLMVPALDNMEDVALSSEAARRSRLPQIILWMLLLLTVASSFLVGFATTGNRRNLIMLAVFALMTTAAFYLVIELDHPRQGFINLDVEVKNIIDLRNFFLDETRH